MQGRHRWGAAAIIAAGLMLNAGADASAQVTSPVTADATASLLDTSGTSTELVVDPLHHSYAQFAVSGLVQPVASATLRLWVRSGQPLPVQVRAVPASWSETSASLPAPQGAALAQVARTATGTWASFDVTPAVRGNGAVAFVLTGLGTTRFAAREGGAEHAPQLVVVPMTPAQELRTYLRDVPGAQARAYGARSAEGWSLDGLDVVALEAGPARYLGVHHALRDGVFEVHVVLSDDLIHWTTARILASHASQPAVAIDSAGGVLVAYEADTPDPDPAVVSRSSVVVERFASPQALLAGDAPVNVAQPSRSLSDYSEGTPSFRAEHPDPAAFTLDLHYFHDGVADRQATATLTAFSDWFAQPAPQIDAALEALGVTGNIGDRDDQLFRGEPLTVVEGQLQPRDFSSWRLFEYDRSTATAVPVGVRTDGGSASIGNPALAVLPAPGGVGRVLFMSAYVFREGAAAGEAGELVWYRRLEG